MAEAITLRLEKPVAGVDLAASYQAFGKNWEALERAAETLDILSPFDFVSETPEEYAAMMKDVKEVEKELGKFNFDDIKDNPEFQQVLADLGQNPAIFDMVRGAKSADELVGQVFPEESPGEEWYDADEGLDFLRQLDAYVLTNSIQFAEPGQLHMELSRLCTALEAARQAKVRFYFALQG